MELSTAKIGFIGGGNMAKAIAGGIVSKGLVKKSQILVSAPSEETTNSWIDMSGFRTHDNATIINKADIIIIATKPHHLDSALKNVKQNLRSSLPPKLIISVLAGISYKELYEKWHMYVSQSGTIIRVMPNTLALICEGCTAIAENPNAQIEDINLVKKLFSALGKCEVVPEYLIAAVTGVSGSGPAYIYMIIEALADGGVKQGLPRNLANTFAAQTVLGAAKMVMETQKHPSVLKDEVCSAGGTTIYAVHELEKGGLRASLMNAVEAASNRAKNYK